MSRWEVCLICGHEMPCGCSHPSPRMLNCRPEIPVYDDSRMLDAIDTWQKTALEYAAELQAARTLIEDLKAELARLMPDPAPVSNPFREFPTERRRVGG